MRVSRACGFASLPSRLLASGSLGDAAAALSRGDVTAIQARFQLLAEAQRVAEASKHLNIFVTQTTELAHRAAEASDARRAAGQTCSSLDGVPIAVKDNFCMRGVLTTAASSMLLRYVPAFESTVTARLRQAGAVIVGKTNMDEFGMGSFNLYSAHGATISPLVGRDRAGARTAGGSSGGSAAAVVAGAAFAAIGTDTGGSVRLPASYTGLVGFKPSYGSLSRWGVIAFSSSLDTPGFLTRTVRDAAVMFCALQGVDELDSTSVAATPCTLPQVEGGRPLRIGVPREYAVAELSSAAHEAWNRGVELLRQGGHAIVPVSLPNTKFALETYYILAPAEAASNLARYTGMSFGEEADAVDGQELQAAYATHRSQKFGPEVQRRIVVGRHAVSSEVITRFHGKAQTVRDGIAQDFATVFSDVDVLLTPSAPSVAPLLEDAARMPPASAYASDVMTVPASLAGLPAISISAGLDAASGLPLGLQLIAARGHEGMLLQCAAELEHSIGLDIAVA